MKYWASNYAIIPIEGESCFASSGMTPESDWPAPRITSWMHCGEHHRRLFLQLLLGSLLLLAAQYPAQAAAGNRASFGTSTDQRIIVRPSLMDYNDSGADCNSRSPILFSSTDNYPEVNPSFQLPASNFQLPTSDFRLPTSNGALLAHQTTSISNPFPTARNGVAVRTPLPEDGKRSYKMNLHFQICTKGYLAQPGIPIPASGLYIRPLEPKGVNVERCTRLRKASADEESGKDGQQECSEFGMALFDFRYSPFAGAVRLSSRRSLKISIQFFKKHSLLDRATLTSGAVRNSVFACLQGPENQHPIFQKARFIESLTPQHPNTPTPQYQNTITPQHHNTIPPQHRTLETRNQKPQKPETHPPPKTKEP